MMENQSPSPVRKDHDRGLNLPEPNGRGGLSPEHRITRLPIVVLSVQHRCNGRCVMCNLWQEPVTQALSPSSVAGWLPEWRRLGVERVMLTGGEPLIYPHLAELTALLAASGLALTIVTNGIALPSQAGLVARYGAELVVSLDGPQPIHDRLRGVPGAFTQLAAGVAMVKDANPDLPVTGRCTVQRGNYRYLRETVAAANKLGLDGISFLTADVISEAFHLKAGENLEQLLRVMLTPADLPHLAAEIEALEQEGAADYAAGYIVENPHKLRRRIWHYFAALIGQGEFIPPACNAPWVSAVIEPDGGVRPCFFHQPLGNLYQQGSLEALLNSPESLAWRRLAHKGHDLCRRCVCSLWLKTSWAEVEQIAAGKDSGPKTGGDDEISLPG